MCVGVFKARFRRRQKRHKRILKLVYALNPKTAARNDVVFGVMSQSLYVTVDIEFDIDSDNR